MVKFFKTSLLYGLLIVLSSALPQWAAAQSRVVSGTVKDEKGTGLPGVTIIVKGTAGGTTSMADGQYSVKVSAGDELEFSFTATHPKRSESARKAWWTLPCRSSRFLRKRWWLRLMLSRKR